jgi:hypothetical protein
VLRELGRAEGAVHDRALGVPEDPLPGVLAARHVRASELECVPPWGTWWPRSTRPLDRPAGVAAVRMAARNVCHVLCLIRRIAAERPITSSPPGRRPTGRCRVRGRSARTPHATGVTNAGSFDGQTTYGLGVRARFPFRVFTIAGRHGRIVIDVAHRWTA